MFGAFFRVGQKIGLERFVLFGSCPALAGTGDRADRHFAVAQPDEDFGRGAHHLKTAKVEEEHEGRGVGSPQRAVEREGWQFKALFPALRGDDLKDVARADIVLGLFHRGLVAVMGEIRLHLADLRGLTQITGGGGRTVKIAQRVHHPFSRLSIGGTRREAGGNPSRGHECHLALDPIQHRHHRGTHQDRIGQAQGIGVHIWQGFNQPDHVIAKIAKQPGRNGRQPFGQIDAAFGQKRPQRFKRVASQIGEGGLIKARLAVDAALGAVAVPDQIGFHADDGVAAAHLAASHGFQHERVGARLCQFQH